MFRHTSSIFRHSSKGFTLVELMVSIGIFVMMTALFIAKYGTFNQSVLLTNLAYDVALTIRTAQTYGLSIKGSDSSAYDLSVFQKSYGVSFSSVAPYNSRIILFTSPITSTANSMHMHDPVFNRDNNDQPIDTSGDAIINTYTLKRGAIVSRLCVGQGTCQDENINEISIDFRRPDPAAVICAGKIDWSVESYTDGFNVLCSSSNITFAEIDVLATDGNVRTIQIRDNGQISVVD